MKNRSVHFPPPLLARIEEYRDRVGYDNTSQAIRALIRRGLPEDGE